MRLRRRLAGGVLLVACGVWAGSAQAGRGSVFDPARHMRVEEVRPGMRGYGLSVFKGTKIERFEVEVVSVLKNFNPKHHVILVRMEGAGLEHTGSIAGMSGSPIYLKDEQGRERMAGAFAYGWPLTKDPVGGVQPIEYMLELPEGRGDGSDGSVTKAEGEGGARPAEKRGAWSVAEAWEKARGGFGGQGSGFREEGNGTGLRALATPMMVGGVSPEVMREFAPAFRAAGLEMLQAGASGGGGAGGAAVKLEPGSVLTVPLMTGDLNLVALGTCTEVIGERVFGFGHSMHGEGAVTLPMGSGRVNGIIPNMSTSFKIGEVAQINGTVGADEIVGIAGRIGSKAPTVPIDLRLLYTDGTVDESFHFDAALHPRLTPMLSAIAVASSLTGGRELPQYNTLDFDIELEFEGGQRIALKDTTVNASASELFYIMGMPLIAASENPFERVPVKAVKGTLRVSTGARSAQLLNVNVPKEKYRPGDVLKAYATYRPFRGEEAVMPVEFELPKDLAEGTYQLRISGWEAYLEDEQQTRPFRFTAETSREMFEALRDVAGVKRTSVYVRLVRQEDGVAIGRTAMPGLPSSRRQVMLESGWSNVTAFVSSTTKAVPTKYVMDGVADFEIVIEHEVRGGKKGEGKGAVLPPRGGEAGQLVPAPKPRPGGPRM